MSADRFFAACEFPAATAPAQKNATLGKHHFHIIAVRKLHVCRWNSTGGPNPAPECFIVRQRDLARNLVSRRGTPALLKRITSLAAY
jgi:hypothetical protein